MKHYTHMQQASHGLFVGIALLGIALVLHASPAMAQTSYSIEELPESTVVGDFVVGPGKTEVTLEPGQQQTIELLVSNRMGDTRIFNLQIEDFIGSRDPDQAVVLLGDERGPYSLKDYIQIPDVSFELEHAQRARIPVTIAVPPDAEPGGLYGSVLVTTTSKEDPDAETPGGGNAVGGSTIISRIGTLFFVTVPGDVEHDALVTSFTTGSTWYEEGPVPFQIFFENKGSVHLNPYGEITITNMLGTAVGNVVIEPWFALPGSLRFREVSWNRPALFGRYTATAEINRGYDNVIDTMSVTFWVFPWKIIALGALGLFIVIVLLRSIFGRFEIRRK